jgi:hypothetical protein
VVRHHHHISVMELGHLLTISGLTYPEVYLKVCHDSFCQLGNNVSLPWVIYYGACVVHLTFKFNFMRKLPLTLSWPAGHIIPTYKESFRVRWGNSIPFFLHAAIYLEVYLFRWTSQNAFSRETAVCTQYHLYTAVLRENAFWLVQRNRYTSR